MPNNHKIILDLQSALGAKNVLVKPEKIEPYRKGFRSGEGSALAVLIPNTLLQLWRALQILVNSDVIIIMQAANTGLTEGSTPNGDDYDRNVVIISTKKINQIQMISSGKQIVAFPGTTLYQLEKALKPFDREPHSVIGSSCIGASVIGGICNNSGGSLIKRGPAYTEMALYAQVNEKGQLTLINNLGINLGNTPEEILTKLDNKEWNQNDVLINERCCSDHEYVERVRDINSDIPARYNSDPRRLYEASGCAGKLAVFAVRIDTFEQEKKQKVFYIGTNDPEILTKIRRDILSNFASLPIAGEYMHRDVFDIAKKYGKDTFLMIDKLGTDKLPTFFSIKGRLDAWFGKFKFLPDHLTDKILQVFSGFFPNHLPARLDVYRDKYEHHLMLKMSCEGIEEARSYLDSALDKNNSDYFECENKEGAHAFLHRFAAAGAAVRYQAIHIKEVEDIVALDVALRRNEHDWLETLPAEIESNIIHKLYYGHFFCHVFHQDYVIKKGADVISIKNKMLEILEKRGAQYPAEHNVGHLYHAPISMKDFYKKLDPTNSFNPGIGKTSKNKSWITK